MSIEERLAQQFVEMTGQAPSDRKTWNSVLLPNGFFVGFSLRPRMELTTTMFGIWDRAGWVGSHNHSLLWAETQTGAKDGLLEVEINEELVGGGQPDDREVYIRDLAERLQALNNLVPTAA